MLLVVQLNLPAVVMVLLPRAPELEPQAMALPMAIPRRLTMRRELDRTETLQLFRLSMHVPVLPRLQEVTLLLLNLTPMAREVFGLSPPAPLNVIRPPDVPLTLLLAHGGPQQILIMLPLVPLLAPAMAILNETPLPPQEIPFTLRPNAAQDRLQLNGNTMALLQPTRFLLVVALQNPQLMQTFLMQPMNAGAIAIPLLSKFTQEVARLLVPLQANPLPALMDEVPLVVALLAPPNIVAPARLPVNALEAPLDGPILLVSILFSVEKLARLVGGYYSMDPTRGHRDRKLNRNVPVLPQMSAIPPKPPAIRLTTLCLARDSRRKRLLLPKLLQLPEPPPQATFPVPTPAGRLVFLLLMWATATMVLLEKLPVLETSPLEHRPVGILGRA